MTPLQKITGIDRLSASEDIKFKTMLSIKGVPGDSLPMLVPVITLDSKEIEAKQKEDELKIKLAGLESDPDFSVNTLILFPPTNGWTPRNTYILPNSMLKECDMPCIPNSIKISEIENLEISDLNKMKEDLKKHGAVSFMFKDVREVPSTNFANTLRRNYNYCFLFYSKIDPGFLGRKFKEREMYVTFFDIRQAIPIFDSRYMDGIGMMIDLWLDNFKSYTMATIFSNHKNNLLIVDGQKINRGAPEFSSREVARLNRYLGDIISHEPKKEKKEPKIKSPLSESKYEKYTKDLHAEKIGFDMEMEEPVSTAINSGTTTISNDGCVCYNTISFYKSSSETDSSSG